VSVRMYKIHNLLKQEFWQGLAETHQEALEKSGWRLCDCVIKVETLGGSGTFEIPEDLRDRSITKRAQGKRKNKVVQIHITKFATYRLEWRWCGKSNCKSCPHGPYWYAYHYVKGTGRRGTPGSRGKTVCTYIGKRFRYLPGDSGETAEKFRKKKPLLTAG